MPNEPERPGAAEWVPDTDDVARLREAAPACRGCELWRDATQVVFSAGTNAARIMLVGEQPGDREDLEGTPFVGPAGRLLAEAVDEVGFRREDLYLTNAVKHFRYHVEPRGKRRIHDKPDAVHIEACRPWLAAEIRGVAPGLIVCLGATAGRAVLGRTVRIGAERGRIQDSDTGRVLITTHPSSVLRLRGKDGFADAYAELVADLTVARQAL
ncbi:MULTISPECIES: UdgX family uracil-DNA binding protein [unclassified Diaminobutyricimonas]|uniref:UdgX family uracil-DNA binding protein n=1 Tax=unclassified Diaminobutyricimonas TaxID=2643261 RepID=UPI0012F47DF5|nr:MULTISPECIES: UdgX family uracil-DNA binding protein [unclassified Diaminobutyricimonas]